MTDIMPRKLPPFVVRERNRHGTVVFYFRRGKGNRTRLPDLQSPEFQDAYNAALSGKARMVKATPSGTLQWLVERYMESGKWSAYSSATRKQHGLFFQSAIERGKNPLYGGITRRTILSSLDDRRETPNAANNFLKAMRGLFKWALLNEYVKVDPTAGIPKLLVKTNGFKVWDRADVEKFCTRWPVGTKPRLAFELILVSGLRRSDMHKAGPQHLRGNELSIRAAKPPHHLIWVEVPQFLLTTIAETPTGDMAFLTKDNGLPFTSKESLGNWFGARCRDAGLDTGKSAHGVRKLSATIEADSGSTTHELMARFGWSNTQQAEVYTRGADRRRLGLRASARSSEHYEDMMPRTLPAGAGKTEKND